MKKILLLLIAVTAVGCSTAASDSPATSTVWPASEQVEAAEETVEATQEVVESVTSPTEEVEVAETQEVDKAAPESDMMAELDHTELMNIVLFERTGAAETLSRIRDSKDTRFVAPLIDTLRYRRDLFEEMTFTLNTLTGQNLPADWGVWVEWAGNHPEINSFADYPGWKANLLSQIDPNFLRFIYADIEVDPDSRVEEIVWGGVRVDGIPALDNPTMIDPEEATYLISDERVFGVSINGDTRAYPARFLDWHEMFNDVVGGEPVSLAY